MDQTPDMETARAGAATPTLQRTIEILILLLVAGTALAHPLCLGDQALAAVYDSLKDNGIFRHLNPWISCGFTPLVVKESLLLTLTAALLFVYCWIKVRGQWLGVEKSALGNGFDSWKPVLLKPELWMLTGLLYAAFSVAWSEVFRQSLSTLVLLAAGVATFLVVRAEAGGRRFVLKFMVLCILCGAVLAILALLQHLGRMPWLPMSDDPRNRMSSLIGHNTGLSSWLMFPLSFSFYFLLTNRRLWVRIFAGLMAALFVLVITAAQSRAIWVLAAAICVIVPWQIYRNYGRRLSIQFILAAVALVAVMVIALSVSPQTNPLARLPVSLEERVTDHILNLDQLRRETRLRILVVSLAELFPKAPVFGTGLGSFAWEYPKAQGDYFNSHPDTWLGTTTRRTDLAHNDYLQVLVETGLLGLALLMGFLFSLAMLCREVYRQLEPGNGRSLWWALAAPVVAVGLHALVDFPFHVAPIALVTLVSAALTTRVTDIAPLPPAAQVNAIPRAQQRKATAVGLAAAIVIFAWLPWGWQAMVGRVLVSDSYYNGGLAWLARYRNSEGQTLHRRLAMADRARRSFREAVVNNLFNGTAYEGQATAHINRAALLLHEISRIQQLDPGTTATEPLRMAVLQDSEAAIAVTENQLLAGGLRYHYTYYVLGRAWSFQWELEKPKVAAEDSKAYARAVSSMRQALEFNPADSASIRELAALLEESQKTVRESQELRTLLFRTDPWSADELLLQPALELAREGQVDTAKAMLAPLFQEQGKHPRVLAAKAWLAYYEAVWPPAAIDHIDREDEYLTWRKEKLAVVRGIPRLLPDTKHFKPQKERMEMLFTAASGEIQEANRLSKALLDEDIWNREARAIYYWTRHKLFGGGLQFEDSLQYYRTRALLALYFMTPREAGLALGELAGREGLTQEQQITLPEMKRLVAFCQANSYWEFLKLIMPALLKKYPGDAQLQALSAELDQRLAK